MTPHRCKAQIIVDILITCQGTGASKTHIIRKVNLNLKTVDPYLDLLIKRGILEVIQIDFVIYKTTANGEQVLKSFMAISEIFS
jgi:predicted transcriptional regulator